MSNPLCRLVTIFGLIALSSRTFIFWRSVLSVGGYLLLSGLQSVDVNWGADIPSLPWPEIETSRGMPGVRSFLF